MLWIGTAQAQRQFTFQIDGDKYFIPENKMNDIFGATFNLIVQKGIAKEKDFNVWATTYDAWKAPASTGYFEITTYGNRINASGFTGSMPLQFLGWESEGKLGKGNPNKEDNLAVRSSILVNQMVRKVIYYLTQKEIIN